MLVDMAASGLETDTPKGMDSGPQGINMSAEFLLPAAESTRLVQECVYSTSYSCIEMIDNIK